MKITFTIPAEHLAGLRQGARDRLDPDTGAPTGETETYDRPYAWAEVKFDPRTGQALYARLRSDTDGDDHSRRGPDSDKTGVTEGA